MITVFLVFSALIGRLYYLQIVRAEYLTTASKPLRTYLGIGGRNGWLPPSRGLILDCNNRPLALNQFVYTVVANKTQNETTAETHQQVEQTIKSLANYLDLSQDEINRHISHLKNPDVKAREIKRNISEKLMDQIEAANIPGVSFIEKAMRVYPEKKLASHLIGFTGSDNTGLAGVEYAFDDTLQVNQKIIIKGDKVGKKLIADRDYTELITRRVDVVLTIDSYIQYVVERELQKKVEEVDAEYANAVVLNAKTGEVLAMANYPRFDPNHFQDYEPRQRQNRLLTDVYEPGSVLKPFIMVAALDQQVVVDSPGYKIYCEEGLYSFREKTIRDDIHEFGDLSVREILVFSSNIGMVKIAQRFGKDENDWKGQAQVLYDYLTRFGFKNAGGEPTLELSGETGGILRAPRDWQPASIGAIPFGQEMSTNTVVLAAAYNALANRGMYRRPHVIKGYRGMDGIFYPQPHHTPTRIVSADVTEKVVDMLVDVTEHPEGTGRRVRIPGFHIAGKTGTAQKYDQSIGTYGPGMRVATFAGFFPANNPRFVIVVMVDEPKKLKYGGEVAGPVWKTIAEEIVAYRGVSPTNPSELKLADSKRSVSRRSVAQSINDEKAQKLYTFGVTRVTPTTQQEVLSRGEMPNLLYHPIRKAIVTLAERGLQANFKGYGKVVKQDIKPGTPLNGKTHVGEIWCEPLLTDPGVVEEEKLLVRAEP